MPRISTQAQQLARKGVDLLVKMYRLEQPQKWRKMVNVIPNKQEFLRIYAMGSLPSATAVNQATGVTFYDFATPWGLDVQKVKRVCGFAQSTEMEERDVMGVLRDKKPMIARSIEKAQEADIASFMGLATLGGAGFECPDGVAWASAAHLLQNGTFSNILSTNAALSEGALSEALAELRVQPDHTGDPMDYTEVVDLWVHPYNEDLAYRLKESQGYPTTPNNDPNYSGRRLGEVVVNPYFPSPAAWALVIRGDQNPFIYIDEKTYFEMMYDMSHDVYNCAQYAIWGKAMVDARGFIYSAGT